MKYATVEEYVEFYTTCPYCEATIEDISSEERAKGKIICSGHGCGKTVGLKGFWR